MSVSRCCAHAIHAGHAAGAGVLRDDDPLAILAALLCCVAAQKPEWRVMDEWVGVCANIWCRERLETRGIGNGYR